jgi:hypothetical protein
LELKPDMADALRARGKISLNRGSLEDARLDLSHAAMEYVRLKRIKGVLDCLEGLRAAEAPPALIAEIEAHQDSLL